MKWFYIFYIIVCFNVYSLHAQDSGEYVGAIKLNDSSIITYRINFEITGSKVNGFSITDLAGEHETKSNLEGYYDKTNNKISFHEVGIIYTKSPVIRRDFCFINFQPSTYKTGKTSYFKGEFKGLFSDGTQCINGEIYLNAVEKVNKRIEKVTKKVNKSNRIPDSLKVKFNELNLMDRINTNVLKAEGTLSVFTKSKIINLELFDGGQEDGDIISITVNGKKVLSNFTVTANRKILPIEILGDKTSIVLIAESVGTISTNTAVIEIKDGENNIRALTNLNVGETTQIDILKK